MKQNCMRQRSEIAIRSIKSLKSTNNKKLINAKKNIKNILSKDGQNFFSIPKIDHSKKTSQYRF